MRSLDIYTTKTPGKAFTGFGFVFKETYFSRKKRVFPEIIEKNFPIRFIFCAEHPGCGSMNVF